MYGVNANGAWKLDGDVAHWATYMVAVVQLVERQFVVLDVAGSSPVGHPNGTARFGGPFRV